MRSDFLRSLVGYNLSLRSSCRMYAMLTDDLTCFLCLTARLTSSLRPDLVNKGTSGFATCASAKQTITLASILIRITTTRTTMSSRPLTLIIALPTRSVPLQSATTLRRALQGPRRCTNLFRTMPGTTARSNLSRRRKTTTGVRADRDRLPPEKRTTTKKTKKILREGDEARSAR